MRIFIQGFKGNFNLGDLQITGFYSNIGKGFQRDTIVPNGTSGTYFSELNNNTTPITGLGDVKATLPSMLFSSFTSPPSANQYFQYRTIFESDSSTAALWPELLMPNDWFQDAQIGRRLSAIAIRLATDRGRPEAEA